MFFSIFFLLIGLAILLFGGEVFVRGSASFARRLRVPPLVIGLTIVAFGTSAPELIVNIFAALRGASDIAMGNILGSNIVNILFILGIAAVVRPLSVKENTTWKEIPLGILSVVVLFLLGNDVMFGNNGADVLTRADGLILISFFIIFLYYTYGLSKVEGEKQDLATYSTRRSVAYIIGGVIALALGGKFMVDGAVALARMAGVSELLIGLTITAVGTSLPELVTSVIAAYRGHVAIAVGNVVGSNIFNILWILGITPVIAPIALPESINVDLAMAFIASMLLFLVMFVGGKKHRHVLRRSEGIFFVLCYIAYIMFVVFRG
ncbi:MAG TPA: sodium:proton exchanger [Candidatus Magasanikbacteria bacterium]|nr:MAG: sodium:proton exchanger [Candidatus Magasanikbacteria bacterium RIFCSPLOWO2_02_FULL_47_16]OGH79650.1 MAG: sodium:proton exchanger [Candidatus Magasanikbacteria bacterium RIFCSPHIGHO2_02_FULL_48_18]OGH83130.1 MAG: sodium:proton exchanger [Candidatus Magasanikbacteria bacterium RIFCSPLOWO2_12_FULL_47_9b]HAZ28293.1 sodium:proton exchanger [Candidatus Magasanikbacteria bacterium]